MKPKSIAHRGYSGTETENTLQAFKRAIDLKSDGIELDVHKSLDDQIVVFHDFEIEISTNKKVAISSLTLNEIQKIQLPKNQKIPTLEEVLDLVNRKCLVNIELKGKKTAELVVKIISNYIQNKSWTYSDFLISSFENEMLLETKFLDDKIRLAIIADSDLEKAIDFAKYLQIFAINPYFKLLDQAEIKRIKDKGFKIFAWTVNEKTDIINLTKWGVDGIISDFPDRI